MEDKEKPKGRLFVLSGPSGVGKGTLRERALSGLNSLVYSISCTTRPPRKGERDGIDYYFISRQEFEKKAAEGLFLEHARVHGDCYGTLREKVGDEISLGRDVVLEIDVQGALQVRRAMPESVLIFVSPPSPEALAERLRRRRTESGEKIALRLENAKEEMRHVDEYNHVVVNDTVERASDELREIILSYRRPD